MLAGCERMRRPGGLRHHFVKPRLFFVMPRLARFIRDNNERILMEWEAFARALPIGGTMDVAALRDHAAQMLAVIAEDLDAPQTEADQHSKAHGHADADKRVTL